MSGLGKAPGSVIPFGPAFVDEKVSRVHPCTALRGDGLGRCGTIPTRPFIRTCKYGHDRGVWLCSTHEAMCFMANAYCRECADRGGVVMALVVRR